MERHPSSSDLRKRVSQSAAQERRAAPLRRLRRRITVTTSNSSILNGQAVDLSTGGARVIVDRMVAIPQDCAFEFSMMIEGQLHPVSGRGRIVSCVCIGMNGFSIGVQFVQLEDASKACVARYLGV